MQLTNNDEMQSEKRPSPAEILDLGFARAKRNADRMMCDLLGADDRTTEGVSAGYVPSNEFVVARDRASTTAVVTNGADGGVDKMSKKAKIIKSSAKASSELTDVGTKTVGISVDEEMSRCEVGFKVRLRITPVRIALRVMLPSNSNANPVRGDERELTFDVRRRTTRRRRMW